jgi:hypothetical protein
MDDEYDDKGWDGDIGDGEVSKLLRNDLSFIVLNLLFIMK